MPGRNHDKTERIESVTSRSLQAADFAGMTTESLEEIVD